jgi:hypothetical protein
LNTLKLLCELSLQDRGDLSTRGVINTEASPSSVGAFPSSIEAVVALLFFCLYDVSCFRHEGAQLGREKRKKRE